MTAPVVAQDLKSAEALGIKTVLVPAGTKISDLVKTEGTLVEIPLAAFEARLDRAAQQQAAAKRVPRLVKATYHAELVGNHLSAGNGNWVVENPGSNAAIMPLTSFNLALQQPRLGGEPAVLADLDGANLGLWVEKPGTQSLVFEWSLRGTPSIHGVTFDLRVPPCPLVAIDLKLPADHSLTFPKAFGMLTGPLPTENPAFKIWRLQVAGRSQIELVVRRGSEAGRAPQLFAAGETRVQFSPEQTLYDYDVQVEALHSPVSELTFDVDSSLVPIEVSSRQAGVQSWRVEPAGNRALVKVPLREPMLGASASFRLRFAGPRWTDQEASLPRIEVAGAVNRGETIKLHLHPDQHLERWDAGAFRLVNSSTDADGSQVMTLADARPGKGAMPRFLLRTQGVDFTVNQDARWTIDPGSMTLVSELQYDISRGQLFDLQVRLPKNAPWRVVGVELQPNDAFQKWSIAAGVLHVDLQRGITPRTDCKLTVRLQDERDKSLTKPKIVDFPDLEPIGANHRQGTLAILADAHERVSLMQSNLPISSPEPSLAKDPRLQFFFAYRQAPVQGKVRLSPQQPILQANVQQQVSLLPDVAKVKASVAIEPIVGQPSYVDLFFSESAGPWKIEAKGAEIAKQERLPLPAVSALGARLGATHWRSVLAGPMSDVRGQVWRVHFREPISKAAVLTVQRDVLQTVSANAPPPILTLDYGIGLVAETALMRMESDWKIPIVVPLDAERVDGSLSLLPLGVSLRSVQSHGLEAASTKGAQSAGPQGGAFARVFRVRHNGLFDAPSLAVTTQRRPRDAASQGVVELAELTTSIDPAGNVTHRLSASVWNWRNREFRIVLPSGSSVVGARLDRIDLDALTRHNGPSGVEVFIPMSQESRPQTVELVYRGEPPSWFGSLGRNVSAPLPTLPSPPLLVRREMRLAPGWLPLWQEDAFSFDRHAPARVALRNVWTAGESLVDEIYPSAAPEWLEPQRLSLLSAEGSLRRTGSRDLPLAEAFARLLFDVKNDPPMIVIDRAAFRTLNLSPKSIARLNAEGSAPFWDELGLAYVPAPRGGLLTTKNRAAGWARSIREADATGTLLADAVAQAAERGQDASGRFQAADEWLRTSDPASASVASAFGAVHDDDAVWQPLPGHGNGDTFVVVRRFHLRGLATFLGLLVLGAGIVLRGSLSSVSFFRAVWIALAACLLAFAIVPTSVRELTLGPCVAVGVLIVVAYRRLLTRSAAAPPTSRRSKIGVKGAVGAILLSALATLNVGEAQAPAAKVVFVAPETATEKARALAPPELLRWLDELDKQARPAIDDVVILAARYQGRWEQNAIHVKAEFDVAAFKDKATLIVPLAGVDLLDDTLLGSAPTLPVVAPAGKTGYQIVVPEKGSHRLTMSFLVRPLASGEVKFSIPRTPCSSLQFVAPLKLGVPRLARCCGEETLKANVKTGEQTLDAQLGNEAAVQIHGLAGAVPAANLLVRELYFWDLRAGNRSAQAVLAYSESGEVPSVEIRLPSSLEVRTVELAESAAGKASGAIKTWSVTPPHGDNRLLKIDFLQPLTGPFEVLLGMTPRWSGGAGAIDLRLPFPEKARFAVGMIGVRLDDPGAAEKAHGIVAVAPDAFVKEWSRLSQREIGVPLRAYSFERAAKNPASATLEITPLPARPSVQTDVALTAQAKSIDLVAKLHVTAMEDVYLLPIALADNVVLRDVQGADVHHWSRLGNTLQVWLVGPRKKTSLTLLGWAPAAFPKTTALALSPPQLVGAVAEPATLALASAAGYVLEPKSPPILESGASDGNVRRFRSPTGALPTSYQLRPQVSVPQYQTLTTAEVNDGTCTVATHVHGLVDHGDFPELHVRQATGSTPAPRLLLSVAGAKVKHVGSPREHKWIVTFPPGTPQRVSFSVVAQTPLKPGETTTLPDLRIERGGQLTDRIVALAGARPTAPMKLANVRAASKELSPWPLEHARLRAAGAQFGKWPAATERVGVQSSEEVAAAPVQPLSARNLVLVGQQDRWMHRTTWSLWVKTGHELEIALPAGAAFDTAFVDDQPVTPRQSAADTISLALSAGQRPRTVVVCWSYPAAKEPFADPRLALPTLVGLESVAPLVTLSLPPGWRPTESNWIASPAEALLAELQAALRTLTVVGDDLGQASHAAALKPTLESFALAARQAQYRIRLEPNPLSREKLEGQLAALIADEQKRAKTFGLDAVRAAADKSPWLAPPRPSFPGADSGAPLPWTAPTAEPRVDLLSVASPAPQLSLLPAAIIVLILSFWPMALRTWIHLWPEQLAGVAILGISFGGFSLVGAALVAMAVFCRGLVLFQVIRRFFRPSAAA